MLDAAIPPEEPSLRRKIEDGSKPASPLRVSEGSKISQIIRREETFRHIMISMARSLIAALATLVACQHTPPVASSPQCPGPYPIERGQCEHSAATECQGLCGYVIRGRTCEPIRGVTVVAAGKVGVTDDDGRFDLVGVPKGTTQLRISEGLDEGVLDVEVSHSPQPLALPLELVHRDRSCGCGGVCPT